MEPVDRAELLPEVGTLAQINPQFLKNRSNDLFSHPGDTPVYVSVPCRRIQGALPRQPIALSTAEGVERRFLPAFTYFCAAQLWCATGGQQMEAPRRTGAEHAELDGLSLSREEIGTEHLITVAAISVFVPSRDANNSLALFQMIISRIQQLTQSELSGKELLQKGLSPASHCISRQFVSGKFRTYLPDYLISGCGRKFAETGKRLNS